jgi:hypothetical protein
MTDRSPIWKIAAQVCTTTEKLAGDLKPRPNLQGSLAHINGDFPIIPIVTPKLLPHAHAGRHHIKWILMMRLMSWKLTINTAANATSAAPPNTFQTLPLDDLLGPINLILVALLAR